MADHPGVGPSSGVPADVLPASGHERTQGYLTVGQHRIEFRRIAPREDNLPTLVLLHEGLGCVGMWRDFPDQLAARTGAGVFVYSRPGYGGSSTIELPRPTHYMHEEAHQVLPAVLAAAGISPCVLVGHSDGGSIALLYAGGVQGHLAKGLILLAAHVFNETITIQSIEAARVAYAGTDLRDKLVRWHGGNVDTAFHGWNDVWLSEDFRAWNIESYLSGIQIPTLVIQGEDDEYGTVAQLETIAAGIGGPVTTELWPQCGHSPHRDQTERLLDRINHYVSVVLTASQR